MTRLSVHAELIRQHKLHPYFLAKLVAWKTGLVQRLTDTDLQNMQIQRSDLEGMAVIDVLDSVDRTDTTMKAVLISLTGFIEQHNATCPLINPVDKSQI